ncbi:hypothetical protein [Acinetobacter sp. YH12052]|nr:hypothetical protein [Acinetobacter sp. YH12052]
MKMLRLIVLVSSALFLAACGNDSNDQQFSNPEKTLISIRSKIQW